MNNLKLRKNMACKWICQEWSMQRDGHGNHSKVEGMKKDINQVNGYVQRSTKENGNGSF
jgi:hypothetical protein